jgi:hypothetical protein
MVCVLLLVLNLMILASLPTVRERLFWIAYDGRPTRYEWAKARDWDKPTDPRELEAYQHAHSLQLGRRLPEPARFRFEDYRWASHRATAAAYFHHLCTTEAGEYIFKTVDQVEGIYQMRAMPKRTEELLQDRYGFEDPADWSHGEENGSPYVFLGGPGKGFRYFESRRRPEEIASPLAVKRWRITPWTGSGEAPYWRYHHFDYTKPDGEAIPVEQLESRHAYTWRGIRRKRDREFGIAGGELIVLDRISGEILGVRRGFAIAHQYPDHLDWEFSNVCPSALHPGGKGRLQDAKVAYPFTFVFQVLKPIDYDASKMRYN